MKHTLLAIVMVTLLGSAGNVAADDSKLLEGLVARFEALQSKVTGLEAEMETKQDAMDCLYQVGNGLYVDGCNLHVQDGTGSSDGYTTETNGLGDLIVGYNEDHPYGGDVPALEKTGSHNLIVGPYHTYTNYSGLVTGSDNTITGFGAAVTGGQYNVASGPGSSVSGGALNTASEDWSSVSGGSGNEASGVGSSVSGGWDNTASGDVSSVSGGWHNTASGTASSVNGEFGHVADEAYETLP